MALLVPLTGGPAAWEQLAEDPGRLNPLWWAYRAFRHPGAWATALAAAVGLTATIGWLLRLGTRPQGPRAALGFTAVTALLANQVALLVLIPFAVANPAWTQVDQRLRFASATVFWAEVLTLLYFVGLGLASSWAVDHVTRSGRRPLARAACYGELYLPVVLLALSFFRKLLDWMSEHVTGHAQGVPADWVVATAALAALVVVAHVGVIRRWHPLARVGLYVLVTGVPAGILATLFVNRAP
jgi:hypothetical protein